MKTLIAENLFTIPNVLSADECQQFIGRGEAMGFEAAAVSTTDGPGMMTAVRNNDRAIFDDPLLASMLWARVEADVPQLIDSAKAIGLNEKFRYYRYDPLQRFNGHRDGSVESSPTERSRLTFMIYLNDSDEGGQTVFYSEERVDGLRKVLASIDPAAGMGLFFAHEWWHEGSKVISRRKYVLRTDVMYRTE